MVSAIANGFQTDINYGTIKRIIECKAFELTITLLIIVNAVILGLETDTEIVANHGQTLKRLDHLLLLIFTAEIMLRIYIYRSRFFTDGWSIFDTLIILIAWMPTTGGLSVLRALRILRILRLVSIIPSLRKVVTGLVGALPGMGSIIGLLLLVYYIFAVMGVNLFGEAFPSWFGSLSKSAYTLFQVMTLEGWSMSIVRPIMEVFPYAWIYFVIYIICTTFTVLNLFVGIIVSAMTAESDAAATAERQKLKQDQDLILEELRALRMEIADSKRMT